VDDPINPKHYSGRECADIGERLTANSYQVLKYCWRLWKKDAVGIELGKALWYIESEITMAEAVGYIHPVLIMPDDEFFHSRIPEDNEFLKFIAWYLINWSRSGLIEALLVARSQIRFKLEEMQNGN
jgi:hypothetical protein